MTVSPVTEPSPPDLPEAIDGPTSLDHLAGQVDALRSLERQIKELSDMRDRVKSVIIDALRNHTVGTVNGRPAVRHTAFLQRRLSPALVRERFTDDELEDCYTLSRVQRFTIVT